MRRLRAECARELFGEQAPDLMKIGRFRLISQLGTGGQGAVYLAEDSTLDRRVALKRITAPDTRHRQRLQLEGQALARIAHAHVVTVHEVGEDETGQPFLVMELVDGQPLHRWLQASSRSWKAIVDVLAPVGEGIAALHEAGVIHRDIKPHNIVITADGKAKLVDLGIALVEARAEGDPGQEDERSPEPRSMQGTVGYMAPEHVGGQADARSDQFSFCVTLFEALYGVRPPWSLTRRESMQPVDAGTPASGEAEGERTPGRRSTERSVPPALARRNGSAQPGDGVPRGLVQVLARGLQHDPERRYQDMAGLLQALHVIRHPRRHWRIAAMVGVLALGLGTPLLIPEPAAGPCDDAHAVQRLWQGKPRDAVHAAFVATGSAAAEPTFTAVDGMLHEATTSLDERRTQICADSPQTAAGQVALAEVEARRGSLGAIVDSLTEVTAPVLVEMPVRLAGPLQRLRDDDPRDACEQTESLLEPTPTLQQVETLQQQAVAAGVAGRFDEAMRRSAEALAMVDGEALAPVKARLHLVRGRLALDAQQLDVARRELEQARSLAERLGCDGLGSEALALWAKGHAIDEHGSIDEAAQASRVALEKLDRIGIGGARRAEALNSRALVLQRTRDHEGAIRLFRQAIDIRSALQPAMPLEVAVSLMDLGISQARQGQTDTAIETLNRSRTLWASTLWPDHPSLYKVHANLGYRYLEKGEFEASQRELTRALELVDAGLGSDSPRAARLHVAMARVLDYQHDFAAAVEHATTADAIFVARHGEDDLRRLAALEAIGSVCMDAGWMDRAIDAFERALAVQAGADDVDAVSLAIGRGQLAQAHLRAQRPETAQRLYAEASRPFVDDPSLRTHRYYPELMLGWGETLVALGRDGEAATVLQDAVTWWDEHDENRERQAHARWSLAQAQCGAEPAKALSQARGALEYFEASEHAPSLALGTEIASWIERGCPVTP